MIQQEIINKLVIIHPTINVWGGKKKLEKEDLGDNFTMPSDLVSLGNKRIVPKGTLRSFESLKKSLHRTLMKFGVQILGGYAVAEDVVDTVRERLLEYEQSFDRQKNDFLADYPTFVERQCEDYPEWSHIIRTAAKEIEPTLSYKFRFRYRAYKIVPPKEETTNHADMELNDNFISDGEFQGQVASEVSNRADEILVRISSFNELKPISLRPIFGIKEKLLHLSSLDRRFFGKAIRLIDVVLGEMPDKDIIVGDKRELLVSLLLFLRHMNLEPVKSRFLNGEFDDIKNLLKWYGYEQTADPEDAEASEAEESEAPAEIIQPAEPAEDPVVEENPKAEDSVVKEELSQAEVLSPEEDLVPAIPEDPDSEDFIDDEVLPDNPEEAGIDDEEIPAGAQEDLDEDYIDIADEEVETFREGITFF